jgi:hypothetical protein
MNLLADVCRSCNNVCACLCVCVCVCVSVGVWVWVVVCHQGVPLVRISQSQIRIALQTCGYVCLYVSCLEVVGGKDGAKGSRGSVESEESKRWLFLA